jgi:uncharacterized protein (TIGR01777 family)
MKVFLTGGTGFVGSYMSRRLIETGHEVVILTRRERAAANMPPGVKYVVGDPGKPGPWQDRLAECDTVINLAGASIFTRWSSAARKVIVDSRMLTTRHVVDALAAAGRQGKETLLLSASAVGYYGGRQDDAILDETSPPGSDFLAEVGKMWEAEAARAERFGVRVALCRFGIVMGRGGGSLEKMVPPFKSGLGSPLGSGKQWFSWIHEEDLFRIMLFLAEKKHIAGPVNCTAPGPVRNEEMTRVLAKALHRPLIAPSVPAFMVKLMLGEFGNVILTGQRVIPKRLMNEGFQFQFPTLQEALADLLG